MCKAIYSKSCDSRRLYSTVSVLQFLMTAWPTGTDWQWQIGRVLGKEPPCWNGLPQMRSLSATDLLMDWVGVAGNHGTMLAQSCPTVWLRSFLLFNSLWLPFKIENNLQNKVLLDCTKSVPEELCMCRGSHHRAMRKKKRKCVLNSDDNLSWQALKYLINLCCVAGLSCSQKVPC